MHSVLKRQPPKKNKRENFCDYNFKCKKKSETKNQSCTYHHLISQYNDIIIMIRPATHNMNIVNYNIISQLYLDVYHRPLFLSIYSCLLTCSNCNHVNDFSTQPKWASIIQQLWAHLYSDDSSSAHRVSTVYHLHLPVKIVRNLICSWSRWSLWSGASQGVEADTDQVGSTGSFTG